MSQEVIKSSGQSVASKDVMQDDFHQFLPKQCATPGYWSALAENSKSWAHEVSASPFWRESSEQLGNWRKDYRRTLSGELYSSSVLPSFVGKAADRIQEKTFKKILEEGGNENAVKSIFDQHVAVPRIEDLVRVRLNVQFLDGVPYLARKVFELAGKHAEDVVVEAKGSLNGYFAQHVRFRLPVYFRFGGPPQSCNVTCEIQIATSLATHVWENSHALYESTRMKLEKSEDWQWNPKDPRFLSRQLGHMIHLADGLFCNLRDQVNSGGNK